jgi:ABC-type uncharacterized transport system permease subunit
MSMVIGNIAFALALLLYAGATMLFFLSVAGQTGGNRRPLGSGADLSLPETGLARYIRFAPHALGLGAIGHLAYITIASFIAHVCPVHSVHFILSVTSLLATAGYLAARIRFRIDAVGLLVAPLGLAFLMGTYFLARPGPEPKLSPAFIGLHVMVNLLGTASFVLAGAAAALYLVQEKRLKKKRLAKIGNLPPLDTLDRAVHRFLMAGFPLLTIGVISGTFWARQLEFGTPDEVMRIVFGYATWLLVAGVLLLRAAAGWRGRRAAYGTIAGLSCALAVVLIYLIRPASEV